MACLFGHKWDGCKCVKCGVARDENHRWNGCKCDICGKTRDEGHVFTDTGDCTGRCEKCEKEVQAHKFDDDYDYKCSICGAPGFLFDEMLTPDEYALMVHAMTLCKVISPERGVNKEMLDKIDQTLDACKPGKNKRLEKDNLL